MNINIGYAVILSFPYVNLRGQTNNIYNADYCLKHLKLDCLQFSGFERLMETLHNWCCWCSTNGIGIETNALIKCFD